MTNPDSCMEAIDFSTDDGLGQRARFGLIVLQSDQTIEYELAALLRGDDIAIYHARIPNAMHVSADTLRQIEQALPATAALLPPSFGFDAIGYACTSGATLIGENNVDRIIRQVHPDARSSNPITACKAALAALGMQRIALLTPYAAEVTLAMRNNLQAAGFHTSVVASFDQSDDFTVARIAPASILDAVLKAGANPDCDGVFVSCTSLRAVEIIAEAEARLGKPVVSSNQVLAWHLMQLAGLDSTPHGTGRLFDLCS